MPTFLKGHSTRAVHKGNQRFIAKIKPTELHPSRELSDSFPRDRIIMHLISRDGDRCYICRETLEPLRYAIDHVIPRSHGGPDASWNYALTCQPCNTRKRDRIISFTIGARQPCFWLPK